MPDYKLYIFDLDGTLYRGDEAIEHAPEAVARIRSQGAKVAYLTNNSTQTVEAFCAKLQRLGFEAEPGEIESSATGTAAYLREQGITKVQALGETGLIETLCSHGIETQAPDDEWSEPAEAVVVGLFRQLKYEHLAKAMNSIRLGAKFIATNADATLPLEGDKQVPGAGTIVRAVETCSGQSPVVIGKPSPFLTELAMRKADVAPSETLVIGDRLDTDIASGEAAGAKTLLVLTGVTHQAPPGQEWMNNLSTLG